MKLANFYNEWSSKSPKAIDYDIEASIRKADVILSKIPPEQLAGLHRVMDFGCGYGAVLKRFQEKLPNTVKSAVGVDYSASAIEIANTKFANDITKFYRLSQLEISGNMGLLRELAPQGVDGILLIDLLEHVPDCKELVTALAEFTKFFIIKLPIENSVFDNYVLPKEYPSAIHSNGHLREFDSNNVHYFVRQLGLTPLYEALYIYSLNDTFPPQPANCTAKQKIVRWLLRIFKGTAAKLLPKKIFLRWVGGGGYFCLATFDRSHILNP